MPPSIVLEVLKILESEINLREETRVTEQSRPELQRQIPDAYAKQAEALATWQDDLKVRTNQVTERIRQLPDAEREFADEMRLLHQVADVMAEASAILRRPDTGPEAIAAETEVIELLLQSRRINPRGGGAGGNSPGSGGTGTTVDSAMVLLGKGINPNEVREDRRTPQTVGNAADELPEEYRNGLDRYFQLLEEARGQF